MNYRTFRWSLILALPALLVLWSAPPVVVSAAAQKGGPPVRALRCEYLTNPLGIDVQKPRLGWTLDAAIPTAEVLERLGLADVAQDLWGASAGAEQESG